MKLAIITPVGPGHEEYAKAARASTLHAAPGPFTDIKHILVDDTRGERGRSRSRNIGIERAAGYDWLFFLDADDRLLPDALTRNDFAAPATFGAVMTDGKVIAENVWPCGWRQVLEGVVGTLSMGFFCRAELGLRFDESLDAGEDFEFYLRLPGFTKRREALVDIGYSAPSAGGPRGYDHLDWAAACMAQVRRACAREPEKFA